MAEEINPFILKALDEIEIMKTSGDCKYFNLVTGDYLKDTVKCSGNIVPIESNETTIVQVVAMQFELEAKGPRVPTSSREH